MIDRVKRSISRYLRLPVPPYENPSYWEGVYRTLGPDDVFEWGDIRCADLLRYQYRSRHRLSDVRRSQQNQKGSAPQKRNASDTTRTIEASLGETLGVYAKAPCNEPIMLLGCGNSAFGQEMVEAGWRGPLIHVDIASRAIESMSQRCAPHQRTGDMQFIQDDATVLSAFENDKVNAVFDKGLVDALFCADAYEQCFDVMKAVNRVLTPGGHFVVLSFSRPEFIFEKMLGQRRHSRTSSVPNILWEDIQIRELDRILLYRFQKAKPSKTESSGTLRSIQKGRTQHRRR